MINWISKEIDLGTVQAGTKVSAKFESCMPLGDRIKTVTVGCNCVNTKIIPKGLQVTYYVQKFPVHLALKGVDEMEIYKVITVTYTDGVKEFLILKGILKK
jgi:hypothetical protein